MRKTPKALCAFALLVSALSAVPREARAAGVVSFYPHLNSWYEYNDNLLLTTEQSEDPILEDQSLNVQPGAHLFYHSDVTHAQIGGSLAFKWYDRYPEYNGLPDMALADALWSRQIFSQTRVELSENLTYYYDPRQTFGARPSTDSGNFLTTRSESIANILSAAVEQGVTQAAGLRAQYTFSTTEYKDPELFDTAAHMAMLTWRQRVDQRMVFVTFGRFTRNLFDNEFDFVRRFWDSDYRMSKPFPTRLLRENDFDTWVPGLGMDVLVTPRLSFEARSGVIFPAVKVNNEYKFDEIEWYQRIAAVQNWEHFRLTLAYTRDLTPAYGVGTAVLNQEYLGNFTQIWSDRFQSYVESSYSHGIQAVGRFDGYRQTLNASYFIFRWMSLGAGAQHYEQFTKIGTETTSAYQNRVLLMLNLSPARTDAIGVNL